MTMRATGTGAVVRKPPGKEPAGCGSPCCRTHYGDFDAALVAVTADVVAGGVIVKRRGAGHEVRVARQREPDADPSLVGLPRYRVGRTSPRPVLDQRARSTLQRRRMPGGLMTCRS